MQLDTPIRPIIHLHIPKTGGQTFAHRIAAALPAEAAWLEQGNIEGHIAERFLDQVITDGRAFVSAHVTGEAFVNEERFDFLAMVRDPIEQIVSNLAHIQREPQNVLHPLTQNMSLIDVMKITPDWFFNVQSRYLITPFFRREGKDLLECEENWLVSKLSSTCSKFRWLAPTNCLDEFFSMFAADMGLRFTSPHLSRNIAPGIHNQDWEEVRRWLGRNADLYAVDTLLYNEAKRRFECYKDQFWRSMITSDARFHDVSARSTVVFSDDGGKVILGSGWALRQESSDWGTVHHAGPSMDSSISVSYAKTGSRLTFTILFVAGLLPEELIFLDGQNGDFLTAKIERDDQVVSISVDLPSDRAEIDIIIRSPRIFPLCLFNHDWHQSRTPIAYAVAKWMIVDDEDQIALEDVAETEGAMEVKGAAEVEPMVEAEGRGRGRRRGGSRRRAKAEKVVEEEVVEVEVEEEVVEKAEDVIE